MNDAIAGAVPAPLVSGVPSGETLSEIGRREQQVADARAEAARAIAEATQAIDANRPLCPLSRAFCVGNRCAIAVLGKAGYMCGLIADVEFGTRRYVSLREPASTRDTNVLGEVARVAERIRESGRAYG